jgi:predicted N-acetyltransferase YhbS
MQVVELTEFGPADYEQIVDGEEDPYGTEHLAMEWRDKSGHVAMVDDERLVAHAGWVPADVHTETGEELRIVGLGGVMVHRSYRGKGLGHRLVSEAMERMALEGPPVGMLFCRTQRVPFYERLGWRATGRQVTADQPTGSAVVPLVTCWTALTEGGVLPDAPLHVVGLPF